MNTLTYEIIAKYIGKTHNVTVKFVPGLQVPRANVEDNVIELPDTIHESDVYGGISTLMHEAAHVNYTKKLPKDLVKDRA